MVGIEAHESSDSVIILGHGIEIPEEFAVSEHLTLSPDVPSYDSDFAAARSAGFADFAAVEMGRSSMNFALIVHGCKDGKELAIRAWDALWLFHLLSLACATPVCSLFSVVSGEAGAIRTANRNVFFKPFADVKKANTDQLNWLRDNRQSFDSLIKNEAFSRAMRCYGNAHYLFDTDLKIMLLWSGIEGLLAVDAELSRRIALYAALILDGTAEQKLAQYKEIKKAYGVRSKAVHGGSVKGNALEEGYKTAASILARLLARCVEIGRIPSPEELDAVAVASSVG